MIDTIPRPDAGLPEFLAARARHASDTRLAANAIAGMLGAIMCALLQFPLWIFPFAIALCFFAFGVWGIADRELGERGEGASRAAQIFLRATQAVAVIVGALAFAALLLIFMAVALGRIIS